jgi:hypothetical protein
MSVALNGQVTIITVSFRRGTVKISPFVSVTYSISGALKMSRPFTEYDSGKCFAYV